MTFHRPPVSRDMFVLERLGCEAADSTMYETNLAKREVLRDYCKDCGGPTRCPDEHDRRRGFEQVPPAAARRPCRVDRRGRLLEDHGRRHRAASTHFAQNLLRAFFQQGRLLRRTAYRDQRRDGPPDLCGRRSQLGFLRRNPYPHWC